MLKAVFRKVGARGKHSRKSHFHTPGREQGFILGIALASTIQTRRFGANATRREDGMEFPVKVAVSDYAWEPIDEALLAYARRLAGGAA
jgi:hypothetical protein